MTDRLVPVIRLTDMSEDMQKEVIEVARVAIDRSSTVEQLSLIFKRTSKLRPISRMISDPVTMELGIASWVETLGHS